MMSDKLSQRLQEKFQKLEEKTQHQMTTGQALKHGLASSTLLGAGIYGAQGRSLMQGAAQGFRAGSIAALLILGGAGIAQLIKRARENGAVETKQSIKRAVANAQDSDKYTNTQKAAIRNNGQAAIAKIDQAFKNQKKHESLECDSEEDKKEKNEGQEVEEFRVEDPEDNADKVEVPESLGRSILEKLTRLSEEGEAKKAAAAGAIGGAVAGHQIRKQNTRNAVKKAVTQRGIARQGVKTAAAGVKNAVNKSGAAKTILNKESRLAGQLAKKNPTGVLDKLKNHAAKLNQKGRVKAAAQNLKGDPNVAKNLAKLGKANANYAKSDAALKTAKTAMRKVGKLGGAGKGAVIGAALGAGAYGLHKLANKNK
jgi:hypothetical protein